MSKQKLVEERGEEGRSTTTYVGLISTVIYIVKISPLQLEIKPITILMVSYMRS
ncbi:unnamed protein product [Ectocarpus sp. CCAP 1310/34]|nr:unnamed protein product [Ectocarpus sp. CCAP 1310/34]